MELVIRQRNGLRHTILYDEADHPVVSQHRWHVQRDTRNPAMYYAATAVKRSDGTWNRNVRMHALVMGQLGIDHINHNGLDNRRENLRPATRSQQGANRKKNRNGSSRHKGVSWSKRSQRWVAGIRVDGRRKELGRFTSEYEAAQAYDKAAVAAWGEHAHPNFIEALGGPNDH